jgi:hypothetical protein
LVMADHVLDPRLLTDLVADRPATGEVVMAVDRAVNDPGVDPGKATRVWVWGDRVGTIGEGLQPYNGFDTGAFVCTPVVFEAVERGKRTPRRRRGRRLTSPPTESRTCTPSGPGQRPRVSVKGAGASHLAGMSKALIGTPPKTARGPHSAASRRAPVSCTSALS